MQLSPRRRQNLFSGKKKQKKKKHKKTIINLLSVDFVQREVKVKVVHSCLCDTYNCYYCDVLYVLTKKNKNRAGAKLFLYDCMCTKPIRR